MTFDERLNKVRLMHETMLSMNDENAYMAWIWVMPDEPSEYDFTDFADEAEFAELEDTFDRMFNRYIDGGLYMPSDEVIPFLKECGYNTDEIDIFPKH